MTLGKFHNFPDLQSRQQFLFCFLCLVVVKIQQARITDPKGTFYSLGVFNLLLLVGLGVHRDLSHKAIHRPDVLSPPGLWKIPLSALTCWGKQATTRSQ